MTHTKSDKPLTTYSVQVFLTDAHGWVAHSHINLELPNFKKAAKMCRDYIRKHIHIGSEGYFEVYKWDTNEMKENLQYKETVYCSNKTGKIHFRINHTSRKSEYSHHFGLNARFIESTDK